jgi:hypothetical protein
MIGWRFALVVVLAAAALAACITYFTAPFPRVEADQRLRPISLNLPTPDTEASRIIAQHPIAEEKSVAAFERAAEAILRRAAYAGASVGERPIIGRIPLPKRRPIPRVRT